MVWTQYKDGKVYILDNNEKVNWKSTIKARISEGIGRGITDIIFNTAAIFVTPVVIGLVCKAVYDKQIYGDICNKYVYEQKSNQEYYDKLIEHFKMGVKGIN